MDSTGNNKYGHTLHKPKATPEQASGRGLTNVPGVVMEHSLTEQRVGWRGPVEPVELRVGVRKRPGGLQLNSLEKFDVQPIEGLCPLLAL